MCAKATWYSCSKSNCCTKIKHCKDYNGWAVTTKCGTNMFFDFKKENVVVADAGLDADVKASCCTASSAAKCSDWSLSLCPIGQLKLESGASTISAPAFPVGGASITTAKFGELCCETKATCTFGSGVFMATGISECGKLDKQFFDLKKGQNRFDATGDAASIIANRNTACCTPFSQALCSDWTLPIKPNCGSGLTKVGTNTAPADGANGITLTDAKYTEYCCVGKATCSSYTCPDGYDAKAGTTKCSTYMADSCSQSTCCTEKPTCASNSGLLYITGIAECAAEEKMFFDLKKAQSNFVVSTDAAVTKANRIAACCTPSAEATCWDWSTVTTCAANTFDAGQTVDAPPDGDDGKTLSEAKYRELCCVGAVSCANAVVPELNTAFTSSVANVAILAVFAHFWM